MVGAVGSPEAAEASRLAYLPDLIKGDLDSVRRDVADFYTQQVGAGSAGSLFGIETHAY